MRSKTLGINVRVTPEEKEKPQSPTSGIADEFIEQCLERYFKKK
mgnify:CR=1 FL=1